MEIFIDINLQCPDEYVWLGIWQWCGKSDWLSVVIIIVNSEWAGEISISVHWTVY